MQAERRSKGFEISVRPVIKDSCSAAMYLLWMSEGARRFGYEREPRP